MAYQKKQPKAANAPEGPYHFQNIYAMDNLKGVTRLFERRFGDAAKSMTTIDYFQVLLALADQAGSGLIDEKEMNRRMNALEAGTIREDGKIRIPQDKYYAVMSGFQQSTVYCSVDKDTGSLHDAAASSGVNGKEAYFALSKKTGTAHSKATGTRTEEMKMDDFILKCLEEGVERFIADQGETGGEFYVSEYTDAVLTFNSSRHVVNTVLGEGISGSLLFPVLITYMNNMIVDISMKDGREMTGIFISLPDNIGTSFYVMAEDAVEAMLGEAEGVERIRVHMTTDPADAEDSAEEQGGAG